MPPVELGKGGRRAFSGGVCLFSRSYFSVGLGDGPSLFQTLFLPSLFNFFLLCLSGPASAREVRTGPIFHFFFFFRKRKKKNTQFVSSSSFSKKLQKTKKQNSKDGRRRSGHAPPGGLHPPPRPAAAERRRRPVRGDWRAGQVQGPGDWSALRDGGGVQGAEGGGGGSGGGSGGSAESDKRRCR